VTAPLFLVDPLLMDSDEIVLGGPEGRHAAVVRRIGAGERVDVSDGLGSVARCEVVGVGVGSLTLRVLDRYADPAPAPRVVVVQALPKTDRGELAVELMTEVGADEIVPWSASRSIVEWRGPRGDNKLERWRSSAREAAKQSRRSRLPIVTPLASTSDVCARLSAAALAVVLHESATQPLVHVELPAVGEIVVVVGPEGGVTETELEAFAAAGATAYRLGSSVLRTSTAGAAAVAVLLARSGRWG
jgi:16S rRNA (uracil1498-N3)-methyltransferase